MVSSLLLSVYVLSTTHYFDYGATIGIGILGEVGVFCICMMDGRKGASWNSSVRDIPMLCNSRQAL